MTEVRSWRDRAACRDLVTADNDPFFADSDEGIQAAIAICAPCPVRDDCLTFAVRTGQQYGIWGGQTEQTIRQLIALDRAGRPHGTQAPTGHPNARKTHCKHGHPSTPPTPTTRRAGSAAAAPACAMPALLGPRSLPAT
jgi:WhiB family transcriptional regulator, redox-sensing transcriptional regulator